jgi:hypothetical protein
MLRKSTIFLGAVTAATCLFADVSAQYDHKTDFGKYHTYSWISVNAQDAAWQDLIANAIDGQLAARGWQKVASGGDASISAVGSAKSEQVLETYYSGGAGGWAHHGLFETTTMERVRVGAVHVDVFDTSSKMVVWHGESTDSLSGDPKKNQKKMEKDVESLFKKFPTKPKK